MSSVKYAARTLLKTPGFSIVAIATMALGIAANTAIFSIVNSVLLRPLPFRDEARVVKVSTTTTNERDSNFAAGDFLDVQRSNRTFEAMAGFREDVMAVAARPGAPVQLTSAWVTSEFFDVLGTPPALGRPFTRAQSGTGGEKLAVLSHEAWVKLFATDTGAVGRPLADAAAASYIPSRRALRVDPGVALRVE